METARRRGKIGAMFTLLLGQSVTDACGAEPGTVCSLIYEWTSNANLAQILGAVSIPLKVALILLVAVIIARVVRRWVDRGVNTWLEHREQAFADTAAARKTGEEGGLREAALRRARRMVEQKERSEQRARTLGTVLRSMASIMVYGLALLISLGEFGINLGPMIAGAGIVGVAIGFGAQSLVRDFLTGIFMLLEDQYGVGDVVDVGSAVGVVEEVKLRTTQIRDINGSLWHIPNGQINRVANMSQEWARAVLDIEVAYDTDLAQAMTVIKEVADGVWRDNLPDATILEEPAIAGVQAFGESSIVIRLMAKVEPGEQWAASREIRRRLKEAFDESGIEIPFPQRTVWVRGEQSPPAGESEGPADRKAFGEFRPAAIPEESG